MTEITSKNGDTVLVFGQSLSGYGSSVGILVDPQDPRSVLEKKASVTSEPKGAIDPNLSGFSCSDLSHFLCKHWIMMNFFHSRHSFHLYVPKGRNLDALHR